MKNLLIAVFVLLGISLSAQVEVTQGSKTMKEGTYNAYTVSLERVSEKEAKEGWEKFMKEYKADVKRDKKAKLYISDNVQMPSIGSNPVDVYTMIIKDRNDASTSVSVWFDTGSGYVNSIDMEMQSKTASDMMAEYASNVLRKNAEETQKDEEDKLKDMNKDAKKLDEKNKDLRKDIAEAKADMLKWEKELEQNEDDQKKQVKAIESQEKTVSEAKTNTRKY